MLIIVTPFYSSENKDSNNSNFSTKYDVIRLPLVASRCQIVERSSSSSFLVFIIIIKEIKKKKLM